MPTQVRESSPGRRREREKKESKSDRTDRGEKLHKKERDRERDRDKDKDRDRDSDKIRKTSSHPHRKSSTKEHSTSHTSLSSADSRRRSSMPGVVEEERRDDLSMLEAKPSRPYPNFSKAHSKEAVGNSSGLNIFTPPSTDVNASKERLANLYRGDNNAPPSPPLTDKNLGRSKSSTSKTVIVDAIPEEGKRDVKASQDSKDTKDASDLNRLKPKSSRSSGRLRSSSETEKPVKSRKETSSTPLKKVASVKEPQRSTSQPTKVEPQIAPIETVTEVATNISSDATSIAPQQPSVQRPGSRIPHATYVPPQVEETSPIVLESGPSSRRQTPFEVFVEHGSTANTPGSHAPPPPPPPPPPVVSLSVPRVDYLLQHGGLYHSVPKNLLYAGKPMAVQQAAMSPSQNHVVVANLFEPFNQLLSDYDKVMSKNGSLAVATGYRSVARRLLDRLETVFARDISSEFCACRMCERETDRAAETPSVSWGEILELVSGRKDLPSWPPFSFVTSPQGLGISLEMHVPMQKLDIDVPEEYREHYIRQSKKTKQSVDRWLNRQGDDPSSPPEEVDDETLTFAILTHLDPAQMPLFKDLLGIVDRPLEPPRRAPSPEHNQPPRPTPTPQPRLRLDHVVLAGLAIQRLYRLASPPRDPETAIYLLNNPNLHNALATLAAISSDEWDILTSGRFDGFLRSGAEDIPTLTPASGRYTPGIPAPPRGATPAYGGYHSRQNSVGSRRLTASVPPSSQIGGHAQYGAPIAFDEETEIATLAEVERDIFTGMEALEDAFEQLHQKAEVVMRALRERSAGLAAAQQRRRGTGHPDVMARGGTPLTGGMGGGIGGGFGMDGRWESETDDGLGDWDAMSLLPDDSASNISSSRRRRQKRRHERRTPVIPIEEDEEDYAESEGTSSPRKR